MKDDTPTFDKERTEYVSERWDVSANCARALQLFEIGYSTSGAASVLGVTEGTAKSYKRTLEETINPRVTETVTSEKPKFDVFGRGDPDVQSIKRRVTKSRDEIDPEFRERERPLAKGNPVSELPKALIGTRSNE